MISNHGTLHVFYTLVKSKLVVPIPKILYVFNCNCNGLKTEIETKIKLSGLSAKGIKHMSQFRISSFTIKAGPNAFECRDGSK